MKVVFCTPYLERLHPAYTAAIEAAVPALDAAGIEHAYVAERGCPYISAARATLARRALDAQADVLFFIDYDVSARPQDYVTAIETPGDVVAGTYRFKKDEEEYMGVIRTLPDGTIIVRPDGNLTAERAPAGFLKVTKEAINRFMEGYPELCFGPRYNLSIDLFNHGAHEGVWWGEDYAFCRRWRAIGGDIVLIPDLSITHHASDQAYPGNFHEFLLRQPQPNEETTTCDELGAITRPSRPASSTSPTARSCRKAGTIRRQSARRRPSKSRKLTSMRPTRSRLSGRKRTKRSRR